MRLDVILDLFLQFIGAFGTGYEDDRRLDDLTAHLVGSGGNTALENVGQLHDDGLDLKRADAVTGRLDNIVDTTDIVVEAVLIAPCKVAGVVVAVTPSLAGRLDVVVVVQRESAGQSLADVDNNLSGFAVGNLIAVLVDQVDIIDRRRTSEGADLVRRADHVADDNGGLGLTEALHDLESGELLELTVDLGVQRFAGGGHTLDGAEIVLGDILLDHHAQHRRRRTEGRDLVLREHRQDVGGVEAIEVIDENRGFTQPLTVDLAPCRLRPTGIGDGEVQTVGIDAVPEFRGLEMSESKLVTVGGDLRITRGAGGEVHQHRVVAAGTVGLSLKV